MIIYSSGLQQKWTTLSDEIVLVLFFFVAKTQSSNSGFYNCCQTILNHKQKRGKKTQTIIVRALNIQRKRKKAHSRSQINKNIYAPNTVINYINLIHFISTDAYYIYFYCFCGRRLNVNKRVHKVYYIDLCIGESPNNTM